MDTTEEVKKIIEIMKESDLTQFEIERDGLKLNIHRAVAGQGGTPAYTATPVGMPSVPVQATCPAVATEDVELIKSPVVGTFYRAPTPESPSFVEVGTEISEESTVCIIEAMKVMNEIQADVKGTITRILVENGHGVEYGQPLFEVKKK